ncbi:tyrosine-protein phosphatase [Paenibacillus sp. HN-1]|uniref:protein-tyrosine phosphatase family protein n=1 Tax=Paenibacillus TaxID=44249 RepID=UPI001CA897EA|nr:MULTISPECIES: tyrosine-protein phosphatase [Paenibacillus]MBY9079328.1 tyrosine-protein phosphatase [Paenibacillus sp. CGMCC 1.18879]MBY9087051.1 tyrosine-protein phosphatase [Paenibacillus sinensis]
MEKPYQALVEDRISFGGAKDVDQMVTDEGVEVVVDLREEAEACASNSTSVKWIQIPLGDNSEEPEAELYHSAIQEVVNAYRNGKKVAFHCGGGKGRTGTVAVGTLKELGLAKTLVEAEQQAKVIRPIIAVKPKQWESLRAIYGE